MKPSLFRSLFRVLFNLDPICMHMSLAYIKCVLGVVVLFESVLYFQEDTSVFVNGRQTGYRFFFVRSPTRDEFG